MKNTTLVFLIKKDQKENNITEILLAMKKRGFGVGRWNGVGGKQAENESIEDAAVRETKEEIEVDLSAAELPNLKVAELIFTFPNNPTWDQLVHVYFSDKWQGEPAESEEMAPKWFLISNIPFSDMWPDDIFWLPLVMEGKFVKASFSFGEGDIILNKNIEVVSSLA